MIILSLALMLVEVFTYDMFLGVFFVQTKKWYFRLPILYALVILCGVLGASFGIIKVPAMCLALAIYCRMTSGVSWWQSAFLGILGNNFLWFTELAFMLFAQSLGFDMINDHLAIVLAFLLSLFISCTALFYLKTRFPIENGAHLLYPRDWLLFLTTPAISLCCIAYMHRDWMAGGFKIAQGYAAIILYALNFVMLAMLKITLRDKAALQNAAVKENDTKKRLEYFYDMQKVYERQGKKLHDYKNQLLTIRELINGGDSRKALMFTDGLCKSISEEMSAVNTNHPVVNAVLTQKYRVAKSLGIKMIFEVGDLSRIALSEEEIVIVFGNLLDNAIRECEKVAKNKGTALINIKAMCEDGQFELYVRNPVIEKVVISDGMTVKDTRAGHGIGLLNVRDVAVKYDGSFAVECDDTEFVAAVILQGK